MKAITVQPGTANSVRLDERPEPYGSEHDLLVQAMALGVCGTDREIIDGTYGWPRARDERLVLGHESLGRIIEAPPGSRFATGDLVVGIVRRPDPLPCAACAAGEWDMCRNGRYTERGIKALDGYGAERFTLKPDYAVKVSPQLGVLGVLLEPASVVAKAWDHIEGVGARARSWRPATALVTGAGPVGLLAAMMAAQRGLDIHVLDRPNAGAKPELVRALGGTYHHGDLPDGLHPDVILECTGAHQLVLDAMMRVAIDGIVCLVGVSAAGQLQSFDVGAFNRRTVLHNAVVFGSVNANRRHYELGAAALAAADPRWLARLITRRVPLNRWHEAFERRTGDIKVIVEFEDSPS
ncbi:MAG: glucose 1-dehydrogenase [Reyranellaceae bacterium]